MTDLEYTNEEVQPTEPIINAGKTLLDPVTKQFAKGNPGGPGRPKGSISITTIMKRKLEQVLEQDGRIAAEKLADNMLQDAFDGKNSMDKTIWSYIDGMPRQNLGIGGENPGDPVQFTMVNLADVHPGEIPTETIPTPPTESV